MSALSPARIVVGKLLGVLVVAAPIALCAVPLLALAATFGGVSVVHVAGAAVLIVVHGVALASVGVGASSLLKRGRSAAPLAMVFSIGPSLWAALPAAVALAMFGSGENAGNVLPVVLVGALIDVVLAAGALLLARDQLSQQSVPRWPLRRIVLFATFALMPIAAFASNFVEPRDGGDAAILAQIVFLVVGAAVFEVCIADARRVDRRSPLRQSLVVGALFALGTLASWLVSTEFHHDMHARGIAVIAAYGFFATTFTALVSSVIKHRAVRPVVAVGLLIALFLGAPILHEFHTILGLSGWPLGFTNFATIIDGHASATSGVAFFLASSAVFCFFARVLSRRG